MTRPILRHAADLRSLAMVLLCLAVLLAPLAFEMPGWLWWARLPVAAFLCFVASIVNHNHMHCPVFKPHALNVILNVLISIARGHSATGIVVPHNLNHHVHEGSAADWIAPRLAGEGPGAVRLARYVGAASANMAVRRWQADAPRLPRRWRRSAILEKLALWTLIAAVWFAFGLEALVLTLLLPWGAALAMLVSVNLLQHDGLDGRSRDFVGGAANWLLFNNGYHTVHHLEPRLHWSLLPQRHAQLRHRAAGTIEEPSLPAYVMRMMLSRGAR